MRAVFGRRRAPPKTAPGVYFAPWTTKTGVAGPHQKASHAPPQHRRPLFGVRELVRARNSHLTNGCARCSGVDARPTKPHQACILPLGHPSWRRCTTPKGEASPGKPSTGAPHHPAFGVRAHLRAHSGHARTKHVMCCARLSTPPKPTMPPRTAHPFRLSKGEITRAAFA